MQTHWLRRLAPFLVGTGLLVVATLVIGLKLPSTLERPTLVGTNLHQAPAPNFSLVDGNNEPVSLATLRGRAVALTFLYTDCPDLCPVTTQKFHQVYQQLGPAVQKVALVAITVDPETDTPQRIAQYSQAMGMTGKWEFLTGNRARLTPIWKAYGVAPLSVGQANTLLQKGLAGAQSDPSFQAAHSLVVYVIDPFGRERRLLSPDFTVPDLLHDLQTLSAAA